MKVMKKLFHLTQTGLDELRVERKQLVKQRGPIAERIRAAREFGDLSENAEYTLARQEQERVESRIAEIETILQTARIISAPPDNHKVRLGAMVTVKNKAGQTKQFQVVGTLEADPLKGRVSDESPFGKALLGKRIGDEVVVNPTDQSYVIAEIS
jgi:transcription elongation factor GreA